MNNINWKAVGISAVIIGIAPLLANVIVGMGHSLIVGFQARGDMEVISEASMAFSQSFIMRLAIWLTIAAVAFWRGRKLAASEAGNGLVNALVAAAIGMLLFTIIAFFNQGGAAVLLIVVGWVMGLGGAYLGSSAKSG